MGVQAATGVTVGSDTYDVAFIDESCVNLSSGCDEVADFDFTSFASAEAAGQALLDQVFVDQVQGQFDSPPELTNGCEALVSCRAAIPFAVASGGVSIAEAYNFAVESSDTAGFAGIIFDTDDTSDRSPMVYAVFTEATEAAVIPLPAGAPLLIGGIGLLGFLRRRRKA